TRPTGAAEHALCDPHEPGPNRLGGEQHRPGARTAGADASQARGARPARFRVALLEPAMPHRTAHRPDGECFRPHPGAQPRRQARSFVGAGEQPERVRVWDAPTGKELLAIQGTSSMAFSPGGKRLATPVPLTGTMPRQTVVKLWDVVTGKELLTFPPKLGTV